MRKQHFVYLALVRLSHRVSGAITEPGQQADVSHLTPDEIEMLISMGAVARVPAPAPKEEPKEDKE